MKSFSVLLRERPLHAFALLTLGSLADHGTFFRSKLQILNTLPEPLSCLESKAFYIWVPQKLFGESWFKRRAGCYGK
jgi:hypothetical protein